MHDTSELSLRLNWYRRVREMREYVATLTLILLLADVLHVVIRGIVVTTPINF